jgi:hypothetical protein
VSLLRTDNTLSRVVSFQSGPKSHESTDEQTAFIEDVWSPHPSLELEAGVRYDRVGAIHSGTVSPRVAWTMKRDGDRTSISGSAGIFVDKLVQYTNVADALQVPRATRWDLGVDRTFTGGWQAHVRYQERYGRDELILQPYTNPSGASTLVLSSGGQSRQRALETTLGYRPASSGHEFYVSYVRSSARGDLNTFDRVEGLSKDPFVQANEVGPLPTDVPNRLIAWGLLRLPGGITFAPFVTVRSGFPYSAIDDNWVYVGQRDGLRLPTFGSLDISVTRIIELPRQLPRARVGLKLYNLIAANTEREIQRDVAAPDYGMRYDQVPRDFSVVCVFLLGRR